MLLKYRTQLIVDFKLTFALLLENNYAEKLITPSITFY